MLICYSDGKLKQKLAPSNGFPGGSEVKASACNSGDLGSIPGSGRSPGEGNGNPLQYSCLENPMDRGAWWATVHGAAKSQTLLSDFTFSVPTKVHIVQTMVFPVVMYGCENWIIKKTEHQRTDAFELWCWRRPLRVSWTARRSNQSILKEINPEYSLGGLMLRLKLQYFGHLMQRTDSLKKTLMLGRIEGRGRRGRQRTRRVGWHHRLNGHEFEQTPEVVEGQGDLVRCSPWVAELDMPEQLNNNNNEILL